MYSAHLRGDNPESDAKWRERASRDCETPVIYLKQTRFAFVRSHRRAPLNGALSAFTYDKQRNKNLHVRVAIKSGRLRSTAPPGANYFCTLSRFNGDALVWKIHSVTRRLNFSAGAFSDYASGGGRFCVGLMQLSVSLWKGSLQLFWSIGGFAALWERTNLQSAWGRRPMHIICKLLTGYYYRETTHFYTLFTPGLSAPLFYNL